MSDLVALLEVVIAARSVAWQEGATEWRRV